MQKLSDGGILVFDELYQRQTLEEVTIDAIITKSIEHTKRLPALAAVSHEAVALRQRLQNARIPAVNWMANKAGGGESTRLAAITLTRSMICDGQGGEISLSMSGARICWTNCARLQYPQGKHGLATEPEDGNDHAAEPRKLHLVQVWRYTGATAACGVLMIDVMRLRLTKSKPMCICSPRMTGRLRRQCAYRRCANIMMAIIPSCSPSDKRSFSAHWSPAMRSLAHNLTKTIIDTLAGAP